MKAARILLFVVLALCTAGSAWSKASGIVKPRTRPAHVNVIDNSQFIDINNIYMWVTNTGSFAWDKTTGNAGLIFPKGTEKTAVFAAGLWLGGVRLGTQRMAISEYSDEYQPGSAVGGTPEDPNNAALKTYKLDRTYLNPLDRDAALADYNAGAVTRGAPVVTVQGDGSLDIKGDQMMWAVYNDLNTAKHTNRAGSTQPLGVEVQQTTFAFNRQGALGNTVFLRYQIINRSPDNLTQMFVSQWSDPDLGDAADDLVGCDTTLSLGFVYNATNNDGVYGSTPPAVGYDFFQGPKVAGVPLKMNSFNKYINGTDPNTSVKSYNYMKGLDADGNIVINPVTGLGTNFQVSGDPIVGSGWLDTNPADRRLMLSSGPFSMAPGDTQVIVAAIVIGQSSNRLASIALMKFFDTSAQAAFDANFDLPNPPNSPVVTASPLPGAVRLSWDTRAETYNEPPYNFEGYVVYQGASQAGPWKRIATYDVVDGITTVLDPDFNEEQGLILPTGKAFGQDVGLKYTVTLDQDAIRGGPLFNGTNYFYSVDSYAVGLGQFPQVLESAFHPTTVTPQTPPANVNLGSTTISTVAQSQVTPLPSSSTDVVTADIVDAATVIDASWLVGFKPACATCTNVVWYLTRTVGAVTDTVVNNWPDFAASDANPVVNGVQVKILSYPPGQLAKIAYVDTAGGSPAALTGAARGLRFFNTGGDYGADYPGSSLPAFGNYDNVEIRFGPPNQLAYRYIRGDVGDLLADFVSVPLTCWDLDTNQQLNVAFREPEATADGIWNPTAASNGGAEPFWVMNSLYTGVQDPAYSDPSINDMLSGGIDLRYHIYPHLISAASVVDEGDKIVFNTSIPSTPNDQFSFTTTAASRNDVATAKSEMDLIKAVPNPYFNHSSYELDQFHRIVRFTHLPERCTLRLFNLAGDLIRTIDKNDNTSQATWDLETSNGLPVGSGIYIFHVDAPGFGTHTGKVAIFMEKERLNTF